MSLDIQLSGAPLGHEIRNIEVRDLDDATFAELDAAYDRYGVIVLRKQYLSPREQVAFSKRFGPLDRFVWDQYNMKSLPEIMVLSNIVEDGQPVGLDNGGRYWHSDMWITARPPRGSMLCAIEVPRGSDGEPLGDTLFASTADAYDTLPAALKARVENLRAVFSSKKFSEYVGYDKPKDEDVHGKAAYEAQKQTKDVQIAHPIVRVHPRTGRKCLYVSEGAITHIEGMGVDQSQELLNTLLAHVLRPEVVYRHKWRVGDVVMWDNISSVHCAVGNFDWPQRRLMHRTTLSSAVLAGAGLATAVTM